MQLLQSTSENLESKISTSDLKLQSFKLTQSVCTKKVNMQGGHSPGKVGEFQSGQGKVREDGKSGKLKFAFWTLNGLKS